MHEMSITQSIVEICDQHAAGRRVLAVVLEIGALSGVVPEAVEFCFEACSRDTLLDGATLTIERVPGTAWCQACQATAPVASYFEPCPACGGYGLEIRTGEELRVKELEVE
ncbi:MAG TPA: hydrogenase maturation nickel metallochaperone HypA [Geobacteraceae bacterium]